MVSKDDTWFEKLSDEEQKEYLEDHPKSKLKVTKTEKALTVHTVVGTDGVRKSADGSDLPDHIKALTIPPAWTDVKFNPDVSGDLLACGKDSKGRMQLVYSEAFAKSQAEVKFRRIEELAQKFDEITAQNEKNRKSKSLKIRDSADCLKLVMVTGVRPGSDDDTGAEVKAYGATTLMGKHVVKTSNGVELHFTGKKGVDLKIPVDDPETAKMLLRRAKESGGEGKLFSNTNDKTLLAYTHTMDGGSFKTKDFRTHLGTSTAIDEISKLPKPNNEKEYKRSVLAVAKKVSTKLGNTPTVALQAYISPVVFAEWRL